jgi:hypothetical protein
MNGGVAIFIVVMTAIVTIGWLINSWIKSRHGAGRQNALAGEALGAARQVELLSAENAGLQGQVGRLEERLAVLERIATDPAERTAREIESLRDSRN